MDIYTVIAERAEIFDVTNQFMKHRLNLIFRSDSEFITKFHNEIHGYFSI